MALQKAMVSSKSNEWVTPQWLFDKLNREFGFTLDPCATPQNAKCARFYTKDNDGLGHSWANEVVFVNPPYGGNTDRWLRKAWQESLNNAVVVCLLVSSTDRSYWHDYIFPYASQIRWIRGRLRFSDASSTAPFASAIIIFDKTRTYEKFIYQTRKEANRQGVLGI